LPPALRHHLLASVPQGFRLRDDAKKLNFPKNPEFGKKLIMAKKGGGQTDMKKGNFRERSGKRMGI
jgi:hypothetical protein